MQDTITHNNSESSINKPASPLVSIGVPVYNESRFIEESLASLLNQDYPNFEIVISDNASIDDTVDICNRVAETDPRVKFHRFNENRGAAENFNRVLELATGKYFMWAAGHDLWTTNFISECVATLEKHPDAAIASGSSSWIDGEGNKLAKDSGWSDTRGMDAIARFFTIFWGNMHPILGMIRMQYLGEIAELKACAGADLIMLSELALKGDFVHAAGATWSRRQFRDIESHQERLQRYKSSEYRLSKSLLDNMFPFLRLPLELVRVIWQSTLPFVDKVAMLLALLASFPIRYISGRK